MDEDGEESRMWAKERERERKKMCEKRMQWGWKLETKEAVNYNEIPTEIYYSHSISIKGRRKRKKKRKKEQSLIKKN